MIEFSVKTLNSDKFRSPAMHFQHHGVYCFAPPGTTEYLSYWEVETDRCIDGYTADDGEWISGYNYFYLNYCPIIRLVISEYTDKKGRLRTRREKKREFPDFYDYDYNYFNAVNDAEEQGKHLVVLKARGKGYSFKGASMLARNYQLIADSKSYAIAAETEYLVRDGLLSKAWEIIDFLDEHTAWAKKRTIDTKMHKRTGVIVTDEMGNKTEIGYKSEVIGVTLKNDPNRARGKRGKLILWEESGCHIRGTKVMLANGRLINVEDVSIGDELMGPDGTPRRVLERHTGTDHMYRVIPNNGHEQIVNSRHIIYGEKQDYYGNSKSTFELTPEQYIAEMRINPKRKSHYSLLRSSSVDFKRKDVLIDPYFMGLWLGDGDSRSTAIANEDKEVIDYIKEYGKSHGLTASTYAIKGTKCVSTALNSGPGRCKNWLLDELRRLNVLNNKDIHEDYIYTDKESRLKLLAGLIDSDGSYSKDKKSIEITQHEARKHIIDKAAFVARSLGMRVTVSSRYSKNRTINGKAVIGGQLQYRLIILNGHESIPTLIPRKQSTNKSGFLRNETSTRFNVEYYGVSEYFGFTVDKDHLFLIDDFTIVHNSFKDILQAWQIARPSVEEDGVAFGLMVAFGTGGDESSRFDGLRELFYNPSGYNILDFNNIWDDSADGTRCGFFVPVWANMSVLDEDGNRLYMDADGNSLHDKAIDYALQGRQSVIDGSSDSRAIDRYIAENPITPQEACLELTGNIFPKKDLAAQLSLIRVNKKLQSHKQVGDFTWVNGELNWRIKQKGDITKYPLGREDNPEGSIVIWEHPVKDAPIGLYIGGCLLPGEQVLTDEGLMNVEDVASENRLVDKDGALTKIKEFLTYDKVDEDIYTLKLSNTYRTTTFTKEHPIYSSAHSLNKQNEVKEELFNFDFNKVSSLNAGDWVKYPNVYLNTKDFDDNSLATEEQNDYWWFQGLWLGDGWCSKNRVYIAFDLANSSQINRLESYIGKHFTKKISKRIRGNSMELSFTDKKLSEYLSETYGKYAWGKRIPEHIKHLDGRTKLNLLLGYLDSDGCVYTDSRGYISLEFVSINLDLLESFQDIAFSIGLVGNLSKLRDDGAYNIQGRTGKQSSAYHLRFGHSDSVKFATAHKFNNRSKLIKIDKDNIKKTRARPKSGCFISKDLKYIFIQIKNISKSTYTGVVYNFETESHSFCTYHIPTHNCDPYDHDKAGTNSLGSTIIYKRFQTFEDYYDIIVAEYTGRPERAEDYYENVRNLLLYYNARLLYENERKGIFPYFTQKHSDYLLADQPDIINDIIGKSTVQRRKGIHMTRQIIEYSEGLIKEWLNEEYAPGKKNLTRILSEPLLEELIQYNDKGNFDRVRAFQCLMIYREQLHNLQVKKKTEEEKTNRLFAKPLFSKEWFETYDERNKSIFI